MTRSVAKSSETYVDGLDLSLELSLGGRKAADLGVGLVSLVTGIGGFVLGLLAGSLGGLVGDKKLLLLGLQKGGALLGVEELLAGVGGVALLLLDLQLQLADLLLVSLQVLLGIGVGLVGVVQSNLELVDVSLELLLDAEKFGLSFGFGLEGSLHRLEGAGVVLASVLELFLLLLDALLDLGTDLGNLNLGAENLALLSLKSGLGLVKSVLELLLLDFESADDLLHLVDGTSSLSELVGEVLDLLAQSLVLTAESLDNLSELLLGVLGLEEIGGGVAEVSLGSVELSGKVVGLLSPFVDDLVEALLLLLESRSNSVGSLDIDLSVVQISDKTGLGLLKGSDLGVGGIKSLLELVDLLGLASLGILKLVGLEESFSLEAGLPLLDVGVGLGELSEDLVLSFDLLLESLLELLNFVLIVLGLGGDGLALTSLLIGGTAGLLELGSELRLQSGQLADLRLGILELANEVSVLGVKTSLEGGEVLELARLLVGLGLELGELELELLGKLLVVELGRGLLVELGGEVLGVTDSLGLVLLNLGLGLLELVELVGELSDGVGVLLAESSELVLVVHVGLLQVAAELGKLSLTLLVDLNLSGGGSSLLVELLAELLQFALKVALGAVSLGAGLTLVLELLLELRDTALSVLDLALELGDEGLFVLESGRDGVQLGLLLLQVVLEIVTLASALVDVLLGDLELSLNLSLLLVEIGTGSLLALKGILEVIKGLLELGLDLVLVVALVLFGLEVLHQLAVDLLLMLLLLVQLGDGLVLLLHLVLERSDLVVLGLLLRFSLAEAHLEVLDLLLEGLKLSLNLLLRALNISGAVFVVGELVVELGKLLGGILLLGLQLGESVLGVGELSLGRLEVGEELGLLLDELGRGLLELLAELLLLGEALFEGLDLVVDSLELLGFLSGLEHWLDLSVELEPLPGTEGAPRANVALDNEESGTLFHTALAVLEGQVPSDLGLKSSEDVSELLVTDVFKMGKNSGLEEDLGETDTEHLLVEGSLVDEARHDGLSALLLIVVALGFSGGEDGVTLDEVWVKGSVRESLSANSDSFQHSVAGKLVEHKGGVDDSGGLLLVGDDATDEMWVGLVEHSHQVVERLSVEHRDSHERSRLSLLLSTATALLGLSGSFFLGGVILPDLDEEIVSLGLFHAGDKGIVEGVLVLLEPVEHIVTHSSGVVTHGEVSVSLLSLWRLWLLEVRVLAEMLVDELSGEGQVRSLWHDTLLIKHGNDTEWLKETLISFCLQVKTEIDEHPLDTLTGVLFLFEDEHVVVEELLQLLVDKVNPQLLERVEVEDFESGDIEHTDEVVTVNSLLVKGEVTLLDEPVEDAGVETLGHGSDGPVDLLAVLSLGHPFSSDLDTWLGESLEELLLVDSVHVGGLVGIISTVWLGLLFTWALLELHVTHVHEGSHETVAVHFLSVREVEDGEGLVGELELFGIIDTIDGQLSLGDEPVVLEWLVKKKRALELWLEVREDLVEDMVATLSWGLTDDTRLLEEILLNVARRKTSVLGEVDTDELSETGRVVVTDSLGVSEGFEDGVGLDDLVLEGDLLGVRGGTSGLLLLGGSDGGEVGNNLLGVLGLSGSRFSGNEHGLVLVVLEHVTVGLVRDGEQVGWHLSTTLAHEHAGDRVGVDRQTLVWVDDDAEESGKSRPTSPRQACALRFNAPRYTIQISEKNLFSPSSSFSSASSSCSLPAAAGAAAPAV